MDDDEVFGAPRCPECAVTLRGVRDEHVCPVCGFTIPAPVVEYVEFDGPDISDVGGRR